MRPRREEQALEEIGRTRIGTASALLLLMALAVTLTAPPLARWLEAGTEGTEQVTSPLLAVRQLAGSVTGGLDTLAGEGLLAGNREILAGIESFEDRLEEGSLLRQRLLPPAQLFLTARLGAGNEQAYVGEDGWLYYRPDVDHLTGPGFLSPEIVERRRRSGNTWERPPEPDPLPALERFAADLAERGIELWLLPTPVKPALEPDRLARRPAAAVPLSNPSRSELAERLERAGLVSLDAARWLAEGRDEEPLYLETDTHWAPNAMERVAERLAAELGRRLAAGGAAVEESAPAYVRRSVSVEGRGDIQVMLDLPQWQTIFGPQTVEVEMVLTATGRGWRPTPGAAVLLLGDSFTNVYSEAALGWGQGAGLAEQLSYFLHRPIDRIALNAGGASASRRALLEALAADPARLDETRVVVYQFAARELSAGDWVVLPLPAR
ncbi:MAG: hypothetical protein R3244_02150 [Thermoanaerobaculia bacterium]|nr:hypothetical protein [Thermoanaerobaculia bacterium]